MYRRSRRRRIPRPLLIGAIAAALLGGGYVLWPSGPDAPAGAGGAVDGDGSAQRTAMAPSGDDDRARSMDRGTDRRRASGLDDDARGASTRGANEAERSINRFGEIEMGRPIESDGRDGAGDDPPVLARPDDIVDPIRTPADGEWDRPENVGSEAEARLLDRVDRGFSLIRQNEPVEARRVLTEALDSPQLGDDVKAEIRAELTAVNERLVFSPAIHPDDPFVIEYRIQSGDSLSLLPKRLGVLTDWRFVQRINRIPDPRRIQVGQRLKMITGPFHAEIDKSDYRLDLFLDDGAERAYVCSFPVGLGEYDKTPEGRFIVRPNSKLVNPEWRNPHTRELFYANDPDNPIGEHWIGLKAAEERLEGVEGYGIHGTIEPESIGRQASMGCIRLLSDDVSVVWEALTEDASSVVIRR
jgi:hypothetical protein